MHKTIEAMRDNPPPQPKYFDCAACDGSGWEEPRHNELVLRGLSENDNLCSMCKGTGKVNK